VGLSIRETVALRDLLGVYVVRRRECPAFGQPSRVAVDEKQFEIDGEQKWLYVAVEAAAQSGRVELRWERPSGVNRSLFSFAHLKALISEAGVLAAAHSEHDVADTVFLVEAGDYLNVFV
jgi:transposase-like protein